MWLFTVYGFVSVVCDRADPSMVLVRARETAPLSDLAGQMNKGGRSPRPIIEKMVGADYAYRVRITRSEWARYLSGMAGRMEATNFKSEVEKTRGHSDRYVRALHSIWSVVHEAFGPPKPVGQLRRDRFGEIDLIDYEDPRDVAWRDALEK